jgi:hypothetical protein
LLDSHTVTIDWGEIHDAAPDAAVDRTVFNLGGRHWLRVGFVGTLRICVANCLCFQFPALL